MTKLIFKYSWIYDQAIYAWREEEWKEKYAQAAVKESQRYDPEKLALSLLEKLWSREQLSKQN